MRLSFSFKIRILSLLLVWIILSKGLSQTISAQVTLQVDLSKELRTANKPSGIGIRGNIPPLSWEKNFPMTDTDGDGIFTAEVSFSGIPPNTLLEYKFIRGTDTWELPDEGNRFALLQPGRTTLPPDSWNQIRPLTESERQAFLIPDEKLQEDFAILKKAYLTIHPGLYRYADSITVAGYFHQLKTELQRDRSTAEAYLAFSRFLAKLRCGHTYCNFYNQSGAIQQLLFHQPDKLPFTFRIVDRRMIVTKNASDEQRLMPGIEILAINGTPVSTILDTLMSLVKSDGANDAKRLYDLQVSGIGEYESFDVYFPLAFPPQNGWFAIEARDLTGAKTFTFSIPAVSRRQRAGVLEQRYGPLPKSYDDLWQFRLLNDQTAYLSIGTFVTYKMTMNWKKFLKEAFDEISRKKITHLVLDIRGNEGGMDEVPLELAGYLIKKPAVLEAENSFVRYTHVPDDIAPFLHTWDNSYKNLEDKVVPAGNGFYRIKNDSPAPLTIQPKKGAFQGEIYLLVDAANSSATFLMARFFQSNDIATLVGQPTGGNRKGTNGGMIFFLRLPHSRIEMDIPVFGNYPLTEQPDEGLLPDVLVPLRVNDVVQNRDAVLEKVKEMIGGK